MADRSLLGVAPLLGETAKVYYDTIFTTTHLGRVTDLVAAKLRNPKVHELRLRTLMLRLLFEAYRRSAPEKLSEDAAHPLTRLATPLTLECGIVAGKLVFSVAFPLPSEDVAFEALKGGTFNIDTSSSLTPFLNALQALCDEVRVRAYEGVGLIEVLVTLEFSATRAGLEEDSPAQATVVGDWITAKAAKLPESREYVQLADLDYEELLKNDDLGKDQKKPKLGDILAKAAAEAREDASRLGGKGTSEETARKLKGGQEDDDSEKRLGGGEEEDGGLRKVKGGGEAEEGGLRKVGGGSNDTSSGDSARIGGSTAPKKGWRSLFGGGDSEAGEGDESGEGAGNGSKRGDGLSAGTVAAYEAQIAAMQQKIAEMERRALSGQMTDLGGGNEVRVVKGGTTTIEPAGSMRVVSVAVPGAMPGEGEAAASLPADLPPLVEEEDEDEENIIQKILKKLFGDKKKDAAAGVAPPAVSSSADAFKVDAGLTDGLDPAASKLMNELELGALEARLKKAQTDIDKDPKAKRLVDGLMTDVMAEKGRLQELAKKVNLSVRQKEIEFRNKETQIKEEMRKQNEVLRQKDYALTRAKDQITQLSMQLEKSRGTTKDVGEDGSNKQKLAHTQKMLSSMKEENRLLTSKMEEFKKQVASMQLHARNRGAANQEFSALQSKYEKSARQMEEFKRANQQLVERLNKAEDRNRNNGAGGGTDDSKKRLEASMRQLTVTKRESERLAGKVAEMQREDMRLRSEITRLSTELKRASKSVSANPVPGAPPVVAVQPASAPTVVGAASSPPPGPATPPAAANIIGAKKKGVA